METMRLLLELLWTIFLIVCYLFKGIITVCLPYSFRKKDVSGQRVLVTGAGSGLGRLISKQFSSHGCTLVLWDVNKDGNEETANQIRRDGGTAYTYTCDISRREEIYKTAERVKADVGDIDILVNNAGIVTGKKILECPDTLMVKTMEVNSMSLFWTTKAFLPAMMEKNRGHLVTIASISGLVGVAGLVDYCASKFAAVGIMESLLFELEKLQKTGIKTTVVCPYYINTGMFDGIQTRIPLILPIMEPNYVVDQIMGAVLTNQPILILPRIASFLLFLRSFLPVECSLLIARFFGASDTMDDFIGRQKKE